MQKDIIKERKNVILFPFLILVVIISTGVVGYTYLENWTVIDALYMTIITITTVGFGEIHQLSQPGRVLTMFIIIGGISVIGYSLSIIVAFIVEGELKDILKRRKMKKAIEKLNNHIIVCGMGETGKCVCEELDKTKTPFVVIERNQNLYDKLCDTGYLFINDDAVNDSVLLEANIKNAKGLVSTLSEDKDNLFTVLTARELNSDLKIISKVIHKESEKKLKAAGAHQLVSPNFIGGMRMASLMIRPAVVSFLDQMLKEDKDNLRLEEVDIFPKSSLCGKTLAESKIPQETGLIVVAMRRGEKKEYIYNPLSTTNLTPGDILIVMGSVRQVIKLKKMSGMIN